MEQYEYPDAQLALSIEVPIPPFTTASLVSQDDTEESREMLLELQNNWEIIWPKMLDYINASLPDLDLDINLEEQDFAVSCSRLKPNEFKSDKADTFISFKFDTGPDWDFFVRGATIVHSQPSF